MRRHAQQLGRNSPVLELNMTAMCDVIFLLLIYLLLTAHPMDVLANLTVNRPQSDPVDVEITPITDMIEIAVLGNGYTINGQAKTPKALGDALQKLASMDTKQTVLITCAPDSKHNRLVQVLDLCAHAGLSKLSVMSL